MLPSATEIVFALGLGDSLAAVTFECDHPAAARDKPVASRTALATDPTSTPREIDREVRARVGAGEAIYTLDVDLIRSVQPDLILAQDLCRVCAVPSGAVEEALDVIGCRATVVSLDPSSLDDVIACVGQVGAATGTDERAATLMAELRRRVDTVREQVAGLALPRTLALEWSDPPFSGGHWVPDMIAAAGGESLLARSGERSCPLTWTDIEAARPEVVVFMPCGYGLAQACDEGAGLLELDALATASCIYAVDASAFFSRPGPRVVDGVELLAWALHPDAVAAPPSGRISCLRGT